MKKSYAHKEKLKKRDLEHLHHKSLFRKFQEFTFF